jgi:RNA polymerase sigma-70 factor, ECF subfamily
LQPNDAQDIVQEVFRTVCGKLGGFQRDRPSSSFRGWLWTITRNRVRLFFRKKNTQANANGGSTAAQALAEIPELWQREDEPATGVETQLLVRRALAAVKNDFAEATWQAFWCTAMEGRSATDVAAELGLTPSAVRQAKYRVLCRLREELAEF